MKHTVNTLIEYWKNSYQGPDKYSDDAIKNIAANCLSLSETWFMNRIPREGETFFVTLFNKNGVGVSDLFGVTRSNLPETLIMTLTSNSKDYSKITLKSIVGGWSKIGNAKVIGELEIC